MFELNDQDLNEQDVGTINNKNFNINLVDRSKFYSF